MRGRGSAAAIIPAGGYFEKISQFHTLWEAENYVLNKTKGGGLLVQAGCEAGDTRTVKIGYFFPAFFPASPLWPKYCS